MNHNLAVLETQTSRPSGEELRPVNGMAASEQEPQIFFLYHELHDFPCPYTYAVSKDLFRRHLEVFQHARLAGSPLYPAQITFDDGCVSAHSIALPMLVEAGLEARFFITAGWTGKREGYMSWSLLREMVQYGQRIGAHGWTHRFLTRCTPQELRMELEQTKKVLEDKLGIAVNEISLPGGRMNSVVLEACRKAGYSRVFTSTPAIHRGDAFTVGRLNIMSNTSAVRLHDLLHRNGKALRRLRSRAAAKGVAKRLLGDALYLKLWGFMNASENAPLGLHKGE